MSLLTAITRLQEETSLPLVATIVACVAGIWYFARVYQSKNLYGIPWITLGDTGRQDVEAARMEYLMKCREVLKKGIGTVGYLCN
jgi:hypothetical protein